MPEIKKRIERYRRQALADGIPAAVIQIPDNRGYLSGFEGSAGTVLITQEDAFLLVDFRYVEQAREQAPALEVIQHHPEITITLKKLLKELRISCLGWEKSFVTLEQEDKWRSSLDGVTLVPMPDLVAELRMVKDDREIDCIRKAAAIADQAFEQIRPMIRAGQKEKDAAIEMEYLMRRLGADGVSFETIIASGPRSAMPHARASDREMENGDLVIIDFGAVYQKYCSDCTRTLAIGVMDSKQKEIYQIVQEAQEESMKAIQPGVRASLVDEVARSIITKRGYGQYFGHSLGHGVGRSIHEEPTLSLRDETLLEPGMVVTVEPGIYIPNWGGVRLEELVLVTGSGGEVLTRSSRFF
ncbi:MAG: aminopeptidase P family protein [Firmicutes bacterium]|nr:aminopeptidase P family protein [Bacillota bacterium]